MPANVVTDAVVREFLRERPSLFAFVLSLVRDFDRAEDVVQETAVVVMEQARDFAPGTDFGAWVRRIARNKVYNANRAARRTVALSPEAVGAIEAAFPETDAGWFDALRHCMTKLADRAREIVRLHYHERLAGAAIAARIGMTVEAVHMGLSRARAALADCVERRLR